MIRRKARSWRPVL